MKAKEFFKDIKIVDFTWIGVGTWIFKYLAEYGAEVIKIESESRPDPIRYSPPFVNNKPHLDGSYMYACINSCKYSIKLDLSRPKAIEIAKRLMARADIVVEGFTPGVMKNLGLGYEDVKKINPDVIMVSTSMQGQTGPHGKTPGTGMTLTSFAGFTHITGWADRPPSGIYGYYTDYIAPLFGASALLAALDYRSRTGKGQYLDVSQFEASVQFLSPLVLDYTVNKRVAGRTGNDSPYFAPHGIYRCAGEDRWCSIAVTGDEQWEHFCQATGNPELARDGKFNTIVERLKNREELNNMVEAWTIKHSPEEVTKILQAAGVPTSVVENGEDLWNDPQLRHYDSFREVDHPVMGKYVDLRRAVEFSKMSHSIKRPPLIGEHTEHVCKQILGMSDEEFIKLFGEGTFE